MSFQPNAFHTFLKTTIYGLRKSNQPLVHWVDLHCPLSMVCTVLQDIMPTCKLGN